jgi:hypothetical protein
MAKVITGECGSGPVLCLILTKGLNLPNSTLGEHFQLFLETNLPDPVCRFSQDFFDGQHQVVVSHLQVVSARSNTMHRSVDHTQPSHDKPIEDRYATTTNTTIPMLGTVRASHMTLDTRNKCKKNPCNN